jgi:hypothetical protein
MKKIDKEVRSTVDLSYFHQAAMGETKLFVQGVIVFSELPAPKLAHNRRNRIGARRPNAEQVAELQVQRNFKVGALI